MKTEQFRATAETRPNGGLRIDVPFDPAHTWEARDAYHVAGTVGGQRFRGRLTQGSPWLLELGPAWCRNPGFAPGDEIDVHLFLEGPQSTTMGDDVALAFAAEPEAKRFFDSMPTFYRNNVARSIAQAKRPDTRSRRIAQAVARAKQERLEG